MKTQGLSEYTTVPILKNFDSDKVIGTLSILTEELPVLPKYAFALGYMLHNSETQEYTLVSVSPIPDQALKLYN